MADASTPEWHGWGLGETTLSVAPSPDNGRAVALILTTSEGNRVLGEFFSQWDAADCMDFLDGAFKLSAQANAEMVRRVTELGG